jgi:hypothetical protein
VPGAAAGAAGSAAGGAPVAGVSLAPGLPEGPAPASAYILGSRSGCSGGSGGEPGVRTHAHAR